MVDAGNNRVFLGDNVIDLGDNVIDQQVPANCSQRA